MPRPPVTVLACLALAAGAAFAGCGSDDKTASTPATPPPATTTPTTTPTTTTTTGKATNDVIKVSMKNIKFLPHDVTAKVGEKILWTNDDGQIPHTVTATAGAAFDSGNVDGGKTFEYTPTKAGKIDYVCTIHSGQTGTITVIS